MQLNGTVMIIFTLSIFLAGITGAFRFHQIRDVYRPFIYLIWVGCINEVLSIFLAFNGHTTFVNSAIYELCEAILLIWFFKKLGVIKTQQGFSLFVTFFLIIWFAEVFFKTHILASFTYYFTAVYYLCIVLLSIRAINDLLFTEKDLLKNPTFLICLGMIIFFTFGIISRMFWLFDQNFSITFLQNMQGIYMLINFLTNLIYALAVLWMRKRRPFTFQF